MKEETEKLKKLNELATFIQSEIDKMAVEKKQPEKWQDKLVQPAIEQYYYIEGDSARCFYTDKSSMSNRKPEHAFKTLEQAELIKEKILLMQEMHAFAHVRNDGWVADWENASQKKWGIIIHKCTHVTDIYPEFNALIFGIVVKSEEIAKEMLDIFGDRIKKFYNLQY